MFSGLSGLSGLSGPNFLCASIISKMKPLQLILLIFAAAVAALAQPAITGVTNGASYIPNGLPNSGVARGALFVIKGSNLGPATFVVATAFPLQEAIAGTSVRVSVGGSNVAAIMYYAGATQVAAILPSSVPAGTGTVTVTANGQTSAPAPIVVVQNALGVFTANSSGAGDAIATLGSSFVTPSNAPKSGDTVVIWGTGLGPVTFNEAQPAVQSDMTSVPVEAFVGGRQANVVFRGRNGCCAAVDTIYIVIPEGVSGCAVPVIFKIGNVVSNTATIPVATSGSTCTPTNSGLSPADLSKWFTGGTIAFGSASLVRSVAITQPLTVGPITIPGNTSRSDSGGASFFKVTVPPGGFGQGSTVDITAYGSCIVTAYSGNAVPTFSFQSLDAGASLGLTGPAGPKTLNRFVGGGITSYTSTFDMTGSYLNAGQYTLTGPGGPDVGSFNASLTLAQPLVWTDQTTITTVNRSAGVTVNWTGGDPAGYVQITGSSFTGTGTNSTFVIFVCNARTQDRAFTVPSVVLLALPPSGSQTSGGISIPIPGGLSVSGYSGVVRFDAPGIDYGNWLGITTNSSQVTYQ